MAKSIKKNYLYNLVFQILSIILPIVTAPYLARVLGVEGVGISAYTLSIVAYFILIANLGIASFGQREIAMHQDDKKKYSKIFWNLMAFRGIAGIVTVAAYAVLIAFASRYQVIYAILLINLLANIFDISWLYQGLEEYKFISIRNILVKLLFTVAIFVFVKTPSDLNLYMLLNGLSLAISTFALWTRLPKDVEKPVKAEIKPFLYFKDTLIYFLPQVATTIYTVLDRTMLGLMTDGQVENGYYEQAYKIISIALAVVTSLNIVVAPRIAFLFKKNNIDEIKERLRKSLRFVGLLAVPISFGIAAIASSFVPWFFGEEYQKVSELLPIFAPIVVIIALSNCLGGQCLTPCGLRLKSALALWAGAVLNLICNLLLIPKFGSFGATIGSLVAEGTITVLYFYLSRKYVNVFATFKDWTKYIIAGLIMFVVVVYVKSFFAATIPFTVIEGIVGVLTYGIVLLVLRDKMVYEYIGMIKDKVIRKKN